MDMMIDTARRAAPIGLGLGLVGLGLAATVSHPAGAKRRSARRSSTSIPTPSAPPSRRCPAARTTAGSAITTSPAAAPATPMAWPWRPSCPTGRTTRRSRRSWPSRTWTPTATASARSSRSPTAAMTFSNTPTFPGLTPANLSAVQVSVDRSRRHPALLGAQQRGRIFEPPPHRWSWFTPNGGEMLTGNASRPRSQWSAADASGMVAAIDLYLSRSTTASSFKPVAMGAAQHRQPHLVRGQPPVNTQAFWSRSSRDRQRLQRQAPRTTATAVFTIQSRRRAASCRATLRDFDQPGSPALRGGHSQSPRGVRRSATATTSRTYEPYFRTGGAA